MPDHTKDLPLGLEVGRLKSIKITSKEDLDCEGKMKDRVGLWGRKQWMTGILPSSVEVTKHSRTISSLALPAGPENTWPLQDP